MPNPSAIVSRIASIEPPLEEALAGKQDTRERVVHFDNGQRARLSPLDPWSAAYTRVLNELWSTRRPAYVEVDSTETISRLFLPMSVKVKSLTPTNSGGFEVELEISHTLHFLKPETPFFDESLQELYRAQAEGTAVLVTETRDDHSIIDVRKIPDPFDRPHLKEHRESPALNFSSLRAVDLDRIRELFRIINGKRCDALGQPTACIPFLYPDDGCWGRAHAMFHKIRDEGEQCGKVWSHYSKRYIPTPNHPCCKVLWTWHVVPVLRVTTGGTTQPWVIDPALFDESVPLDTWLRAQGGPHGITLVWTVASVFYRNSIPAVSGSLSDTEEVLFASRINLALRSAKKGAPPYGHCPPDARTAPR